MRQLAKNLLTIIALAASACSAGGTAEEDIGETTAALDAHCVAGPPPTAVLTGSCAAGVCASDPYCCSTAWDGICVGEYQAACGVEGDHYLTVSLYSVTECLALLGPALNTSACFGRIHFHFTPTSCGLYTIRPSDNPNTCLTVPAAAALIPVVEAPCIGSGGLNQLWEVEPRGDGTFRLIPHFATWLSLDVFGGNPLPPATVGVFNSNGNFNQIFRIN